MGSRSPKPIASMLPRSPTLDWTLTQYETALVRVHLHSLGAMTASAELTLSTRCRHRRFTELPRPVVAADARGAMPEIAATFEVPVAMLYRAGLRAKITVGPVRSALDWSQLASVGPRPAAEFGPVVGRPSPAIPQRRALLRAAPDQALPRRRATAPVPASARATARAAAHGRPPLPPAADSPPGSHAAPRTGGPGARGGGDPAVRAGGPDARGGGDPAVRAAGHPAPGAAPPADSGLWRARRSGADGGPPIAVDSTLLQFLPYDEAAPRLAMPISLTGDVLRVAVALPSVDLSFITDHNPWLRIEREVTGYHRIVQALREVAAMDEQRGALATPPGAPGSAAAELAAGSTHPGLRGLAAQRAAEPSAGARATTRRLLPATASVRRLRAIAASARAHGLARAGRPGIAGALARLARDRARMAVLALALGVAATAALVATSPGPVGFADAAPGATLDTTACIAALAVAWLALASYRRRCSAGSPALALGVGALAVSAVVAVTALGGGGPRLRLPGGLGDLLTVAASSIAMQSLAMLALAAAALALASRSRRSGDDLLAWCAIGVMWLAVAHVNALLAPAAAGGDSAADLFRLAAVACLLVGVAREIAAQGRRLAADAVADERRRMARELHDGVAQELAFIVSQASSLARHERPAGPLQSIALAGERALIDSRRSIHKLTRPDASTLHEAITEQASQWASRAGLELEVQMPEHVQTSPEMQHAILRIVQEAISNAVRHAGATRVMVSLSERDGSVTVRISDDGRGFDGQPCGEELPERGFGLVSMAERAEAFGGELRLESEPGRGTVVEVAFR